MDLKYKVVHSVKSFLQIQICMCSVSFPSFFTQTHFIRCSVLLGEIPYMA